MSANFVLDILLSLIVILFIPIGFWRGALKEVLVTASILLGAAIGLAWAAPWGDNLAGPFDIRHGVARFIVAALALFLSVLLLGYAAGTLLRGPEPSAGNRLLGCVVAAVNGALLLGYALTFINSYLLDNKRDQAINNGRVAGLFLHHFDWVVLASAIALALAVIAALVYTATRPATSHPPTAPTVSAYGDAAAAARRYPPRVPVGTDGGKFEPNPLDQVGYGTQFRRESAPVDAAGFNPSHWGNDRDVPAGSPDGGHNQLPSAMNGYGGDVRSADEWLRRATSVPWGAAGTEPADAPPHSDFGLSQTGTGDRARCPVCGGSLGPNDAFCPLCGSHV